MNSNRQINLTVRRHSRSRLWHTVVMALICAVVFCTVYALIIPAITLEPEEATSFHYSSDLAEFTEKYEITDIHGNPVTDDTVYIGENYYIKVYFKETNIQGDNKQFRADSSGQLTYQFDNENLKFNPTDWCDLIVHNEETNQDIVAGRFRIDVNGKLEVEFYEKNNRDVATPGVYFFDHYTNTDLNIEFSVNVDNCDEGNRLSLNLGNSIRIDVDAPKTAELEVTKRSTAHSEATHSISYAVNVNCVHGAVTDLVFTDTARIKDTLTGVEYDSSSGMFTIGDVVIKDSFGEVVTDEHGDPITDIDDLPDTLTGGEGYEITYTVYFSPQIYDKYANYSISETNSFQADGKDLDGNSISDEAHTTSVVSGSNLIKSGSVYDRVTIGGVDYSIIRWTVTIGDMVNNMGNFTLTDVLGETDSHYYTGIAPTYRTIKPNGTAVNLTFGDSAVISNTSPERLTLSIPGGGSRYDVVYYTYTAKTDQTVSNDVSTVQTPQGYTWERSGQVAIIKDKPVVDKEITSVDDENIYYRVVMNIPKSQFSKKIYFEDELQGVSCRYENIPYDLEISIYDQDTGQTKVLTPYSGSGDTTDTYKLWVHGDDGYLDYSNSYRFRVTFPAPSNPYYRSSLQSYWPYDDDIELTMTYRIPRTTQVYTPAGNNDINRGDTLDTKLGESNRLSNKISVNYGDGWDKVLDEVFHNEMKSINKKGAVEDTRTGTLSYKVAFTNEKFKAGGSDYSNDEDKETLIPQDSTDAYFHDEFDERTEIVDGTLYALIYQKQKNIIYNLSTYYGENLTPFGVFEYTGDGIVGNEITAHFSDFTVFDYTSQFNVQNRNRFTYHSDTQTVNFVYNIAIPDLHNLQELMRSVDGECFGVVFIYKTRIKDEYRQNLSETETVMTISNSADVGWSVGEGIVMVGPVISGVDYNTQLLKKEYTHISEDERIHYTIMVNEYGFDLTDKEYFTIADTMCDELALYLTTVSIEEGTIDPVSGDITWSAYTGDPKISYDDVTNTLSAVIPDDRPMRLSYDCRITKTGDVSLYNTVEITGYTKAVNTSNAIFNISGSGGSSGGGSEGWLYVRKNDAETHLGLNGATFALYGGRPDRYGNAALTDAPETVTVNGDTLHYYRSFTTTSNALIPSMNGTFSISDVDTLEINGHFALKEIKAPEGYEINNDVIDFYWMEAPEGAVSTVPVYIDGSTIVINDEPEADIILPETGGIGVLWYITGGILLMATALEYGYSLKRRRKRGTE